MTRNMVTGRGARPVRYGWRLAAAWWLAGALLAIGGLAGWLGNAGAAMAADLGVAAPRPGAGPFLDAAALTPEMQGQIAAYAREALQAVIDGRAPVAAAALPAVLTEAANGAEVAVLRGGKLVASGHSLGPNFLNNVRLAAGRAVYGWRIDDLDRCAVAVVCLGAPAPAGVPAPVFRPRRGFQAFQLTNGAKKYYLGALPPLVEQWDWPQALGSLAAKALPDGDARARLEWLASPATRLQVFPAVTVVAPPLGAGAAAVLDPAPAVAATPATTKAALAAAGAWWLANQPPAGGYADALPVAADGPEADLQNNALAAAALGKLWRRTGEQKYRLAGLKILDWLLINYFLEAPGADFGYLCSPEKTVDLGTNAAALWAIAELDAASGNEETAKAREMLVKFVLGQRGENGAFRPWFRPEGRNDGAALYQALAVVALLKTDPARHGAAARASLEQLINGFAPRAQGRKLPEAGLAPWLTLAAVTAYAATREQGLADYVDALQAALAPAYRQAAEADVAPLPQALAAWGEGQALSLSKLRGGAAPGAAARHAALMSALLSRQAMPGGAWAWLAPEPGRFAGAFLPGPCVFQVALVDMAAATLALDAAGE